MNAIFGLLNLDGRPVEREPLEGMRHVLNHRGPDGSSVWVDGPAALGCQSMRITPESRFDSLSPGGEDSHLKITASVRLDNRGDLCRTFGIPLAQQAETPDSLLILLAYEKWNVACPTHLEGDFAFAIWDCRQRRLFCVTDYFSVCPIYYHRSSNRVVFSSEIKGILAVPDIPSKLHARALTMWSLPMSHLLDQTATFYEGVYRLGKGSFMLADDHAVQIKTYWKPAPGQTPPFKSDGDWLAAFRDLWSQSVGARLRCDWPVAVLLSGGLDSSSVAATAAHILQEQGRTLTALSAVCPDSRAADVKDERSYIEQFRSFENIEIEYISDEHRGPFDDLERLIWSAETIRCTSRHFLYSAFSEAAGRRDVRVILEGGYGEMGPSSYVDGYLPELLFKGRWIRLLRELNQSAIRANKSIRTAFKWLVVEPIAPAWVKRLINIQDRLDLGYSQKLRLLNQEFLDAHIGPMVPELLETSRQLVKIYPDQQKTELNKLQNFYCDSITAFGGYEQHSRWFPFLNKRLMEFCLSVPGHLKRRDGRGRYLLRAGMEGVLPPAIQWRITKGPFSPDYHFRYNRQRPKIHQALSAIERNDPVRRIVDIESLKALSQHEMTENHDRTAENYAAVHTVPLGLFLIQFLRQFDEFKP